MYTSVTFVWMEEDEVQQDTFSFYGPAPTLGDVISLRSPVDGDGDSEIPAGGYLVQERALVLPDMRWDVQAWSAEYVASAPDIGYHTVDESE